MNKVYDNGGILAAECHGPSVFAFLKGSDDELLIKRLDVTGYPDEIEPEEVLPFLPYSLEQELREVANYIPEMDKKHMLFGQMIKLSQAEILFLLS